MNIVRIDASRDKNAALLRYLQLSILPNDEPQDAGDGCWWVAYDGGLPIGFGGVVQSVKWLDAGYLCRSGVLRSHRGQGIQKRLLRVRERYARSIGWNWLVSDTFRNPASSNSLISCGYRIFTPSAPWSFDGAIYWRKELS